MLDPMAASLTARRQLAPYHRSVPQHVLLRHIFIGVTFTRIWAVRLVQQGEEDSSQEQLHLHAARISSPHGSARMVHLTMGHDVRFGLVEVSIVPQIVYAITCFYSQVSHLHLQPVIRRGHPRSSAEAEELLEDQQYGWVLAP